MLVEGNFQSLYVEPEGAMQKAMKAIVSMRILGCLSPRVRL